MPIIGIVCGALTLLWYVALFGSGGMLMLLLPALFQVVVWVLALASFALGLVAVLTHRDGLTSAALVIGAVALVVAVVVALVFQFPIIPR